MNRQYVHIVVEAEDDADAELLEVQFTESLIMKGEWPAINPKNLIQIDIVRDES